MLPSSAHLFAFIAALALIAIVSIGFFTSNLHNKIQILEDQLRSKIGEYNFELIVISAPLTICGYPNFSWQIDTLSEKNTHFFTNIVVDGSEDRTTNDHDIKFMAGTSAHI